MRQGASGIVCSAAAAIVACMTGLAGCGSGTTPSGPAPEHLTATAPAVTSDSYTGSGTTTSLPSLPPSSAPGSPTGSASPGTLMLRDADDGRTVRVSPRTHIVVTLASTYWTIAPSSNPTAVRDAGGQTVAPQLRGCVPGGGCGTVSAGFDAVAGGSAALSASRSSCGEALRCTGSAGRWAVTVVVSG